MNPNYRLFAVALAAVFALLAVGVSLAEEPAKPPVLQALPEIAPPPNLEPAGPAPEITITKNDRETVEEARVNGILLWIKVTPRHGRPYYLVPTAGGNQFIRRDSLDTELKVPMWVLFSW